MTRANSSACFPATSSKPRYAKRKVADALTPRAQVHTITQRELGKDPIARADKFFNEHLGIHKLLVVDDKDNLRGLFTMSDIERITQSAACSFKTGARAAFSSHLWRGGLGPRNAFGELDRERILNHVGGLVERGVDVVAVSTAHGHSRGVGDTVKVLRDAFPNCPSSPATLRARRALGISPSAVRTPSRSARGRVRFAPRASSLELAFRK